MNISENVLFLDLEIIPTQALLLNFYFAENKIDNKCKND